MVQSTQPERLSTGLPMAEQPVQTAAGVIASRNLWVECLRIVAAFGIVWYHSRYVEGRFVAYGGLIAFVVLAAYFEATRVRKVGIVDTARRLLLPWLFWSLAFAAINIVQHDPLFVAGGIVAGTAPHLWYLPFIFVVVCTIRLFRGRIAYPAVFALGVMIVTATAWRAASQGAGPPFAQWVHAVPAALFGVILAQNGRQWTLLAGIAVGAMTLLFSLTGVGTPYTIGCATAAFALTADSSPARLAIVTRVTPLLFGVYLIHPIFLSAGHRLHLLNVPQIAFAFVASIGAVAAMRTTAIGRMVT